MNDLTPTNLLVNGYFYSFTYLPPNIKTGHDQTPLVFVVGPSIRAFNNLIGINLHHLPVEQREFFIRNFQRLYGFMDKPRTVLTESQVESLLPGISIAKREYNRKYISNCFRLNQEKVPLYIYSKGHLTMETPKNTLLDWMVKNSYYKSKENAKIIK